MASGSSDLVPDGTVAVFDRHEQFAALSDADRDRLRAVILSHDSDPIAALRPELMIRRPQWLVGERGRRAKDALEGEQLPRRGRGVKGGQARDGRAATRLHPSARSGTPRRPRTES